MTHSYCLIVQYFCFYGNSKILIIHNFQDFQTKKFTKAQSTQQTPQSQPISQAKKGVAAAKTTGAQPTTHKEPQQQKSKEPAKKAGTQQPQQTTKSKQGEAGDNQATKGDNQVAKTAPKPKETVTNNGTVKPASNFNAEDDCEKLNRAMSYDDGADETVVVAILPKRSNKQRQEIKKVYEQKYKKVGATVLMQFNIGRIG